MDLTYAQFVTAAGVLLGFQITAFTWRISREVKVSESPSPDLTWLPVADMFNLASMLTTVFAVFLLPIFNLISINSIKHAFGLALLFFIGFPFTLAGHYELYNWNTPRSMKPFPFQEKLVSVLVCLMILGYLAFWICRK